MTTPATYYVPTFRFRHTRWSKGQPEATYVHIPEGYQGIVRPADPLVLCDGGTDHLGVVTLRRDEIVVTSSRGCVHNGAID